MAGIIYVVDGSRPVRDDDLAEIEILRRTGRPRMAVINSKTDQKDYSSDWKHEFLKNFNAIRVFNSNTAGFNERIAMLESLKPIDQEWEKSLSEVIRAFESDWLKRKQLVCSNVVSVIESCLVFTVSEPVSGHGDNRQIQERLNTQYQDKIKRLEQQMFQTIRRLFKHHLFEYHLPEHSILTHDLFSKQTWELLGLTTRQLAGAGAVVGGSLGAALDTAAAGLTFGVFTAIGGALGAGSALFGGKKITRTRPSGLRLGGNRLTVGPNKNPQFLYVLLDRALIYTAHMMNRAHGRRDKGVADPDSESGKQGYTTKFSTEQKKICARFFKQANRRLLSMDKEVYQAFNSLVESQVDRITSGDCSED